MSIRIVIAKWLAPEVFASNDVLRNSVDSYRLISQKFNFNTEMGQRRTLALQNIVALRTPSCAHIGKRMSDIADAALSSPSTSKAEQMSEKPKPTRMRIDVSAGAKTYLLEPQARTSFKDENGHEIEITNTSDAPMFIKFLPETYRDD